MREDGNRKGSAAGGLGRDAEEAVLRYSAMGERELRAELEREAEELRARGLLDVGKLEEFCALAAPYLGAEQLARMRELIRALR